MNTGYITLSALALAIAIGILGKVNIGIVACGAAFLAGRFVAGIPGPEIVAGWPTGLFFILTGMSLLFGTVSVNGTLDLLVKHGTAIVRGHNRLLPLLLLLASTALSAAGPGNISVVAVMMPLALAIAREEKLSPLLVSLLVILGANAGGLSPIAPTGIIANDLAARDGMDVAGMLFANVLLATLICALATYFALGGWRIPRGSVDGRPPPPRCSRNQAITLAVTGLTVLAIILTDWNIGLLAFLAAGILLLLRAADETRVIQSVPWPAILLVCGVATMVNLVERTGGMQLLTGLLARFMNTYSVGPVMSVISGLMSLVSSASGVVMPTLIPTVRGVAAEIEGVSPESLLPVIGFGSHIVTVSPFSTLGALAIASAGVDVRDRLFRRMMLASLLYLLLGAVVCYGLVAWN